MLYGRVLMPDGPLIICASQDNDPKKIGIHMLAKFKREGVVE